MSYTISLFSVSTKQKEQQSAQPDFFEKEENLEKFTPEQQSELENRLLKYQYKPVGNNSDGKRFEHADFGEAFLTDSALYFSTSNDFDCIFEVGMTASEFLQIPVSLQNMMCRQEDWKRYRDASC